MQDLTIRVTQRTEFHGRAIERTIDIEALAPKSGQIVAGVGELLVEPLQPLRMAPARERWERIPASAAPGEHVAVIDHQTGLMWSVESLGDPADADDGITQEHCIERCKHLRLLGHEDWRLPTRAELVTLIDDTRHDPTIDTAMFPKVKPRWHWSSTAAAWSSASAWGVYFGSGSVNSHHRYGDGFALAVRRAAARAGLGQPAAGRAD